jgi:hypothetical protein
VVFLCLAFSIIINDRKRIVDIFLLILCAAYIGASSEITAVIIISISVTLTIYSFMSNKDNARKFVLSAAEKKTTVFFLILLLSFISNVIAPGGMSRQGVLESLSLKETGMLFRFYDGRGQFALSVFFHLRYILCLVLLFLVFLTSNVFLKKWIEREKLEWLWKKVKQTFFIIIPLTLLVSLVMHVYIFRSNIGPMRSWMPVAFFWIAGLYSTALVLGAKIELSNRIKSRAMCFALAFSIVVIGIYVVRQYSMTTKYSASYDKRWELLKTTDLSTEKIDSICHPVSSGMLIDTHLTREEFEKANWFE